MSENEGRPEEYFQQFVGVEIPVSIYSYSWRRNE